MSSEYTLSYATRPAECGLKQATDDQALHPQILTPSVAPAEISASSQFRG